MSAHHTVLADNKPLPNTAPTITFIQNKGQWDNEALFMAKLPNGTLFMEPHALFYIFENGTDIRKAFKHPRPFAEDLSAYTVQFHSVRVQFSGSSPLVNISGNQMQETYYNFFQGNQPSFWRSHVPAFEEVSYVGLYKGIDAHYYTGQNGQLKYDFIIAPQANPSQIQLTYSGQNALTIKKGQLQIQTTVNNWVEQKPYAYQWVKGAKKEVACNYKKIPETNTVQFELGKYDTSLPLIIDPQLIFSTYSGSSVDNFGHTATYDNDGNLYAAGIARNTTAFPNGRYPVTPGAFQQVWGGGQASWPQLGFPSDISISKYTPDGSKLIYATYLGGNKNDYPHSIVADKNNNLIILGTTLSTNFPTTLGAYDVSHNDTFDIIVSKLSADGTALIGSTYIGGSGLDGINAADTLTMNYSDEFRGEVIVNAQNQIIIASCSNSSNFPTTVNAFQPIKNGKQDGVIFKLDSTLKTLLSSTYMGQSKNDALYSLDIAADGSIYLAGGTESNTNWYGPSIQVGNYLGGIADAFFAKVKGDLSSIDRFIFWGTPSYDQGYFIRLDPAGKPTGFGQNFGRMLPKNAQFNIDSSSLFITQFSVNLDSAISSLTIGNKRLTNALPPSAFMIDECGTIYGSVWGGQVNTGGKPGFLSQTLSLPITGDAEQPISDGSDFYLFVIRSDFDSLLYGSYYGENGDADHVDGGTSRFDKKGIIYQSVCASCSKGVAGLFPTTVGSFSPSNQSPRCSNASFKLDFRKSNVVNANFTFSPKTFCLDSYVVVNYTNQSYNGKYHYWYVNGVLKDTTMNFRDTVKTIGTYTVRLIELDSSRCIIRDSSTQSFTTSRFANASFLVKPDTCSPFITFTNTSTPINSKISWYLGDGDTSTAQTVRKKFKQNGKYQILLITNPGTACSDSAVYELNYDSTSYILKADFSPRDTLTCEPFLFNFTNLSNRKNNLQWILNSQLVDTTNLFDTILDKGKYTLSLIVRDSLSCNKADTSTIVFKLVADPFPQFTFKRDSCSFGVQFINQTLLIPGDTVSYFWDFGNGDSSFLENPVIQFDTGGTYNITLTTNKGLWCQTSFTVPIHLDTPASVLKSNFKTTPLFSCSPSTIELFNQSVNDTSIAWYINNKLVSTSADTLRLPFTQDTILNIRLIVTNPLTCNKFDTSTEQVIIENGTRSLFTYKRDTCSGKVIFTNLSSSDGGLPLTYIWYFGDGQVSNAKDPEHTYTFSGQYSVSLVTNPGTFCRDSTVIPLIYDSAAHILKADFSLNAEPYCIPASLFAENKSTNGTQFEWRLNGVLVSVDTNFVDTIRVPGKYELLLTATDKSTCKPIDTITRSFVVNPSASPAFAIARDSCSLVVSFINQSIPSNGQSVNYRWLFGDGDSSIEFSPTHTYPRTDFYTVSLLSNIGAPCQDTLSRLYYFDGDTAQEVFIPNVFTPNNDGLNDCFSVSGISPKCDQFEIAIYNRWGAKYFESKDGKACWNGKNEAGKEASPGVYYYIIKYTKNYPVKISREVHGTVTLIRE